MTVYELNQICFNPIVIYTMCGDKEISIFTQCNRNGEASIPELFDECDIHKIWCEDDLIAVLIQAHLAPFARANLRPGADTKKFQKST